MLLPGYSDDTDDNNKDLYQLLFQQSRWKTDSPWDPWTSILFWVLLQSQQCRYISSQLLKNL